MIKKMFLLLIIGLGFFEIRASSIEGGALLDASLALHKARLSAESSCRGGMDRFGQQSCEVHKSADIANAISAGCFVAFSRYKEKRFDPWQVVNKDGDTLLHSIGICTHPTITQYVLASARAACKTPEAWSNFLNQQNKLGRSALYNLIKLSRNDSAIDLFLEAGVDPNAPCKGDVYPLYVALTEKYDHAVRSLVSYGANLDQVYPNENPFLKDKTIREKAAELGWKFKMKSTAVKKK